MNTTGWLRGLIKELGMVSPELKRGVPGTKMS